MFSMLLLQDSSALASIPQLGPLVGAADPEARLEVVDRLHVRPDAIVPLRVLLQLRGQVALDRRLGLLQIEDLLPDLTLPFLNLIVEALDHRGHAVMQLLQARLDRLEARRVLPDDRCR